MIEIKNILVKLNIKIEHFSLDNNSNDPIGSLIRFVYEWIEIDILATKYKFQELAISNAKQIKISNGETINIISLNDLIIFKIYANSLKDLWDADALIKINIDYITKDDIFYIRNILTQLWKVDLFDKLINYE